jgi:surface antigen
MNAYRVKEIMWVFICLLFLLIALSGCSTTSSPTGSARQYCYTKQEIRTKDKEQVSSETLVKCSDDHVDRITIKKAGIAQNCSDYTYYVTLNGRSVEQRGLACEKFNGTWEIIPNAGYR